MKANNRQLRADVAALATADGRMVGSAGHDRAREFLCTRMSALGLEPYAGSDHYAIRYTEDGRKFCNLAGVIPGIDRQARPVLIGAHYDSVIAAPCADDNAAAVAITLDVATQLLAAGQRPATDVLVIFFDAEEPPYFLMPSMGSIRFVLDQMDARGVKLAIIQDLTGHGVPVPFLDNFGVSLDRIKNLVFMTGAESHARLPGLMNSCLPAAGLSLLATLNDYVGDMSDHHAFRTFGLPYLFFSCGRWEHYHQITDTPEKLNYEKMSRIAELLASVTLACTGTDFPSAEPAADTTSFEIATFKNAFGMFLPLLLPVLGLRQLENRGDLDQLTGKLLSLGL